MATQEKITIDPYTLLTDAYQGSGGFKDGSYLFQHKRERDKNYQVRQSIAYYLNYMKPTVNSHVDPIFRKEPARSINDDIITSMVADVDGAGTGMTQFMKNAGFLAKLKGVSFIVTDNATSDQQAKNVAAAKQKRQFPYCYVISADKVTKWSLDKYGNINYIVYKEPLIDTDNPDPGTFNASQVAEKINDTSSSSQVQYKIWTKTDWAVCDKDGGILDTGTHDLGRVPITPLFGGDRVDGQLLIESDFFPIAKTNLRIFNLCSELDEMLRNQAFAILTYPHKEATQMVIGINNALGYNGAEVRYPPQFIAPPYEPAEMLQSHLDRLIDECYRMAMLTHQTSGTDESRTGAAKEWDYAATNKVLANFSANCSRAESDIVNVACLYLKKDSTKLNYSSRYTSDFNIRDTQQDLADAASALKLQAGQMFNIEVKKMAATSYLRDIPDEQLQAILQDIATNEGKITVNTDTNATNPNSASTTNDATKTTTSNDTNSTTEPNTAS